MTLKSPLDSARIATRLGALASYVPLVETNTSDDAAPELLHRRRDTENIGTAAALTVSADPCASVYELVPNPPTGRPYRSNAWFTTTCVGTWDPHEWGGGRKRMQALATRQPGAARATYLDGK